EPGVGAWLNLGECYVKQDAPARAWHAFKEAERMAATKNDARLVSARKRAAEMEVKLYKITAVAEDSNDEIAFTLDGESVTRASLVEGIFVAPGEHALVAKRGGKTWNANPRGAAGAVVGLVVSFKDSAPVAAPVVNANPESAPKSEAPKSDAPKSEQSTS